MVSLLDSFSEDDLLPYYRKGCATLKETVQNSGIPWKLVCYPGSDEYDELRKKLIENLVPQYTEMLLVINAVMKYRPKWMLTLLPGGATSVDQQNNMVPEVELAEHMNITKEQASKMRQLKIAYNLERSKRLERVRRKYEELQGTFSNANYTSIQDMATRYLAMFDSSGQFIRATAEQCELEHIVAWISSIGVVLSFIQKAVMFATCTELFPDVAKFVETVCQME